MLLPLLLLLAAFGPGLLLSRKLRWAPIERLTLVIGGSLVFCYVAAGAIYLLGLSYQVGFAVSGFSALCLAIERRQIVGIMRHRPTRRALLGFAALFCWTLLLLGMVRAYSGAQIGLDWYEHYQRTLFFLEHQPLDTRFLEVYSLPARPPLMNLLGAFLLGQGGDRFELFQIAFTFLNLLVYFPACALARRMGGGRRMEVVLLFLFAACPLVAQNATYAWTKGLTNFYVLAGLALYLRGWHRREFATILSAFLALAAGILVHYSAAPFALLVAFHFLAVGLRGSERRIRDVLLVAASCAALLGTWLAWSFTAYGVQATFAANTTVTGAQSLTVAENLGKMGANFWATLVPHPLRMSWSEFVSIFPQPNSLGLFRDYVLSISQTNLVLAMGCVAGIVAVVLLIRLWRAHGERAVSGSRTFWMFFVIGAAVLTVASHPTYYPFGVAEVSSQPLVLAGLCLVAAHFGRLSAGWRMTLLAGGILDFVVGIYLHFELQRWSVVAESEEGRSFFRFTADMPNTWSVGAANLTRQTGYALWADRFPGPGIGLPMAVAAGFCAIFWVASRQMPPKGGWAAARSAPTGLRQPGLAWRGAAVALTLVGFGVLHRETARRRSDLLPSPPLLDSTAVLTGPEYESADAHAALALALHRRRELGAAVAEWTHAVVLDPAHGASRHALEAMTTFYGNALPKAATLADEVRANPASPHLQNELGLELAAREHWSLAARRFEEALRLDPASEVIRANLDAARAAERR